MRLRLPEERPVEPPVGYKIAHPVLSGDGARAGFLGVSLGGREPYGVLDDARCAYGRRHRVPSRLCDCGFHALAERSEALGLTCTAEHRRAVLLEVTVLGAYIRFELGFRYARQRVRAMTVGDCPCAVPAVLLADAGWGRPGWHALEAACGGCVRRRTALTLAEFAEVAGEGLRARAAPGGRRFAPRAPSVPELVAEAALLQARLDWFQTQLSRHTDGD
ncbi:MULTISPECIES: hypothetical protein [Streptomyces]|uniref:Uncharacterized protein n=2 Tax=Streptomyces TaxID=1883 RepID=A0A646KRH0_STRJU|nr:MULTISPECIES: hypothetical protein [Streptomyces]MQS34345.1 hypothetical protein [Streptomyces katsurahamanus]MQT04929.1 hypothetical protein [Streptomyces jumonjinensis]